MKPDIGTPITFALEGQRTLTLDTVGDNPSSVGIYIMDADTEHHEWFTSAFERFAACWNACLGLELPATLAPGTLKELVGTLREMEKASNRIMQLRAQRVNPHPHDWHDLLLHMGYARQHLAALGIDPSPLTQPS